MNKTNKLAVDIALLPSEEMTDFVIGLNKAVAGENADKMILNTADCLPHCTLSMGFIDRENLEKVTDKLQMISEQFSAFHLVSDGLDFGKMSSGYEIVALHIQKQSDIQQLHEMITNELPPYLSSEGSGNDFHKPQRDEVLSYIKNFKAVASFEKYNPHITIGLGKLENIKLPITFTADKLALCHLGDNYTCAKILWSVKLNDADGH
ncbi:2'-5' RNA ligase family protein [Patescibacteria group bacterium]|jgi:2'-5' RNA ligase|nr:2'-5' RNA ligase family protein [Patescibacteria group bacterium]MCL5114723.1 2'-5' RNA ligase family protein [Patescibacteria group bacterium]